MCILASQAVQVPCMMMSPIWAPQSLSDMSVMIVMLSEDRRKGLLEQAWKGSVHHRKEEMSSGGMVKLVSMGWCMVE